MLGKTQYRIRQNGLGSQWLEYKGWLFWKPVPTPYYNTIYGREFCSPYYGWVCNEFEWFAKTYPDIKVYLEKEYYPQQQELENEARLYWEEYEKRKRRIDYVR